jgi:hypothetical protein
MCRFLAETTICANPNDILLVSIMLEARRASKNRHAIIRLQESQSECHESAVYCLFSHPLAYQTYKDHG